MYFFLPLGWFYVNILNDKIFQSRPSARTGFWKKPETAPRVGVIGRNAMTTSRPAIFIQNICRFVLILFLTGSIAAPAGEKAASIKTLADLNGKRISVLTGTMLDEAANAAIDYTRIIYYDDNQAQIAALRAGEIDAIIDDEPVARYLSSTNPDLIMLEEKLQDDDYALAVHYGEDRLHRQLDQALGTMIREKVVDDLVARWVEGADIGRRMPNLSKPGTGKPLRFGISSVSAPFAYLDENGKPIGLDVELMERLARRLNRPLEVVDMEFSLLIPSLVAGKVDVIGSCLSVTEERKALIHFTQPYYKGGAAALILAD